ncbi:MAG: sulfatase family protein [Promethearchaeota archaeon]|jgi:arylsulfatase A-like enzyme
MTKKMNVLFIITDQHRADHMSCAGNSILKTPHLDKLASEGVRFTSAYVTNPICMPNRASIFTGLYPNMHGIRTAGMNLPESTPTFTETLRENGYHTAEIGKIHLNWTVRRFDKNATSNETAHFWIGKDDKPPLPLPYYGFEEVDLIVGHGDICGGHYMDWLKEKGPEYIPIIRKKAKTFFGNPTYRTEVPEELYPTSYITERSIAFLERYSNGDYGENPFFLNISYPDPHHPVCPPGKYFDMYKSEDMELPSSFNDIENVKKHPFLGKSLDNPFVRGMVLRTTNEKEAKDFMAATYGSVAMIDNSIGQILTTLEKLNLADNTMVIYTSDHGDLMGDHGMLLKGPCPYNGILNVPFIWKVPGVTKPAITDSLASSIDISKTILNLLNIPKEVQPPDIQGKDLTPILTDPLEKVRDFCLVEHDEEIEMLKVNTRLRHFITKDYKLTVYNRLPGYGDLFDRKKDPHELNNLWYDEDHQQIRHELMEQLFHANLNAQSRYPKREAMS